jgi:hypothetical protein
MWRASASLRTPKRVRVILAPTSRANRASSNSVSSSRMATEMEGCETFSSRAAAVVLPVSAVAAK